MAGPSFKVRRKLSLIREDLGIAKSGSISPERFTRSRTSDADMLRRFTPAQRAIYRQAELEHRMNALRFKRIESELRRELLAR